MSYKVNYETKDGNIVNVYKIWNEYNDAAEYVNKLQQFTNNFKWIEILEDDCVVCFYDFDNYCRDCFNVECNCGLH